MRRSREETAETRRNIVKTAGIRFRQNGICETGLADLMESAGLTHGGFYRHFDSKDQLVSEASAGAFAAKIGEMQASASTTRSAATKGILKMIATVAERMKDPNTDRTKKSASVFVATMLGALTISRIVANPKVSNEILAAARAKLSSWE